MRVMRAKKTTILYLLFASVLCFMLLMLFAKNRPHKRLSEIFEGPVQAKPQVRNENSKEKNQIISEERKWDEKLATFNFENDENAEISRLTDTCSIDFYKSSHTDIQMLELYTEMKFDNPDGGVWKQGWDIEIDNSKWNSRKKLKVFVVPHSHNDPGWIITVERYYKESTKYILDNVLKKLAEDPRRKFIWAEISYFSMWWDDISDEKREIVKSLLKQNQLEIVTGGWVMNDEANSHWLSIVHQLAEGHQWLHKNLNYTPRSHWSIDPFGLSATQPFLLNKAGFQNMLIQRVHYAVKKQLALSKNLEFKWKQTWDTTGETDIFTQVMPFYSYDIPHTCGPNPKICCQFDFKRLTSIGCPWSVKPQSITDANVAERANLLLDQYRKKSMLYKTNSLLIPLGDDFRYSDSKECDFQFINYQKLMDYMNSNKDLNVEIQFGTLSDYFDAVHEEMSDDQFSSLSGDFFTYSDIDDNYWSGYYTSRPFYKRMDRILLSYLRSAEIILALSKLSQKFDLNWDEFDLTLSKSRQELALFQHHDGITGTAKNAVVIDYGIRMFNSLKSLQKIIGDLANKLLSDSKEENNKLNENIYKDDDIFISFDGLPTHEVIFLTEDSFKYIIVYNSLPFQRLEVVTLLVATPYLQVLDYKGNKVECQISPVFQDIGSEVKFLPVYELSFVANIKTLGIMRYAIQALEDNDVPRETHIANVKIFDSKGNQDFDLPNIFVEDLEVVPDPKEFIIENDNMKVVFTSKGLLKSIVIGLEMIPINLYFAKYGAKRDRQTSGAYIFMPDGPSRPIEFENPIITVVKGPIVSKVNVSFPNIRHSVKLYNYFGAEQMGLEIENIIDIKNTHNFELVMKIDTNIENSDEFFTDLNSYQLMRRKRFSKLPLQANYYPMPSMMYIEDKKMRLTVLTSTPLGCSSLKEGEVEIMQDRRLNQDDNRGLVQGVTDNLPTRHLFRIILEQRRPTDCFETTENHPNGFPSLAAHITSQTLLNPLIRLVENGEHDLFSNSSVYAPSRIYFGTGFTLPVLRTGVKVNNKDYIAITLHRQHLDLCFKYDGIYYEGDSNEINLQDLLSPNGKGTLTRSSLTYLHLYETHKVNENIELCPMELKTYLFST